MEQQVFWLYVPMGYLVTRITLAGMNVNQRLDKILYDLLLGLCSKKLVPQLDHLWGLWSIDISQGGQTFFHQEDDAIIDLVDAVDFGNVRMIMETAMSVTRRLQAFAHFRIFARGDFGDGWDITSRISDGGPEQFCR